MAYSWSSSHSPLEKGAQRIDPTRYDRLIPNDVASLETCHIIEGKGTVIGLTMRF